MALALLPFRPSLGPGGFLFCALLVVMAAAVIGGTRPALAGVVLGDLAGAFFFAPPYDDLRVHLNADLVSLVAFAIAGLAAAILIGRLARLAGEQTQDRQVEAALRRVATLVAHGTPADELFSVVTEEVGRLVAADFSRMGRYDSDDSLTYVAAWSRTGEPFPVGSRWPLAGENVTILVSRTGRPARMDDLANASGPLAAHAREWGIRSVAGVPIIVEDRIWGVMVAGSSLGGRRRRTPRRAWPRSPTCWPRRSPTPTAAPGSPGWPRSRRPCGGSRRWWPAGRPRKRCSRRSARRPGSCFRPARPR